MVADTGCLAGVRDGVGVGVGAVTLPVAVGVKLGLGLGAAAVSLTTLAVLVGNFWLNSTTKLVIELNSP